MKNGKKIIIYIVLALVLLLAILFIFLHFQHKDHIVPTKEELKPTDFKRVKYENASEIVNYATCVSKTSDENCYLIVDRAMLTLKNSKVTKEDGDTTDVNSSLNNGLNSAILATYDTIAKIEQSAINTSAEGATGIFANGRQSSVEVYNTKISTLSTASPGLAVSNSGSIKGDHVTINTKVKQSPALRIAKSGGSIELEKSMLETNGSGSPIIDAEGNVKITETTGSSGASRIAVIKNKGNVVINNSSLLVSGGTNEDYPESGVLIYSDNKKDNTVFQSINSSLNINQSLPYYKIAYFFVVDKATAEIDLESTALNFGSNKLLKLTNSDLTINLKNQVIYGNIEIENSNLNLNMIANSSYTGAINNGKTSIYLSKDSELNLTGDMHIKELKNDDQSNKNITTNGYHLYVNNELVK